MRSRLDHTQTAPKGEPNAFDIWLGQTLQRIYEPVIHEPLPREILESLPPAPRQG